LIDLQINGGFGADFTSDPASIWTLGTKLPSYGVTAFLPTIITSPEPQRPEALKVLAREPPSSSRGAIPLGFS
jgi:N-acetylglucosamine-6-phosphate deacetylase